MGNKNQHFPFIWIQSETRVKNLVIDSLHRREWVNPVDTIHIGEKAEVDELTISNLTLENHTDSPCAKLKTRN